MGDTMTPGTFYVSPSQTNEDKAMVRLSIFGNRYRFSLFFDGTLNNKHNIDLYAAKPGLYKGKGDSYLSAYSNVAKMHDYLDTSAHFGYDGHKKIYIDGIGTSRGQTDSDFLGAALGASSDGIVTKVDETVSLVADMLNTATKAARAALPAGQKLLVEMLSFDVFGFSRGAAAARHFIHRVMGEPMTVNARLAELNYDIQVLDIEVTFAGLFDTVASHGIYHRDDVAYLHLDAVALANRVVHLTAADEYRSNFILTDISSAVALGRGLEIALPGAHSDIGGGYTSLEDETNWEVYAPKSITGSTASPTVMETDRKWLVAQGWYTEKELTVDLKLSTIIANRKGIKDTYSRIPLRIMVHHASQAGLSFDQAKLEAREPLESPPGPLSLSDLGGGQPFDPSHLSFDETLLPDLAAGASPALQAWSEKSAFLEIKEKLGTDGTGPWQSDEFTKNQIKILRHRYFHFSCRYAAVPLAPHAPRWVGSSRVRDRFEG